jgi:hypothetical protein
MSMLVIHVALGVFAPFVLNSSQPVGTTRFELDDLIHSAVPKPDAVKQMEIGSMQLMLQ